MNLLNGIVLVLSLLILLFLGPEWIGEVFKKPKRFKKAVRTARTPRTVLVAFGRKTTRFDARLTQS